LDSSGGAVTDSKRRSRKWDSTPPAFSSPGWGSRRCPQAARHFSTGCAAVELPPRLERGREHKDPDNCDGLEAEVAAPAVGVEYLIEFNVDGYR